MDDTIPDNVVFLSHTHEERELALLIKSYVEESVPKVRCFVSSDATSIEKGANWLESLKWAVGKSKVMLVLCSYGSIGRFWVSFEVGAAWLQGITIIPICHSAFRVTDLPIPLSLWQACNLDGASLRGLSDRIAKAYSTKDITLSTKMLDVSEIVVRATSVEREYFRTSNPQGVFTTRQDFYDRVAYLLGQTKREVLDTSWGPDPPKQDETVEQARARYRDAAAAVRARGLTYIELHAGLSQGASDDIERAVRQRHVGISVLTRAQIGAAPRFEFMVIDRTTVLLSRAYAGYAAGEEYLLEINDPRFASFMAHHFEECERLGQRLGHNQNGAIIDAISGQPLVLDSEPSAER
jgi:hypothetical protein